MKQLNNNKYSYLNNPKRQKRVKIALTLRRQGLYRLEGHSHLASFHLLVHSLVLVVEVLLLEDKIASLKSFLIAVQSNSRLEALVRLTRTRVSLTHLRQNVQTQTRRRESSKAQLVTSSSRFRNSVVVASILTKMLSI